MRIGCLSVFVLGLSLAPAQAAGTNGLAVTFVAADGKATDRMILPNLWLFVTEGAPPTPFLPPGKFTAVFEGAISADLRSDYIFQAEKLGGSVKLEINDAVVFETTKPGALSQPVQLNKGPNRVRATYTAPAKGDAFMRIGWTETGTNTMPIPNHWITYSVTPDLQRAQTVYQGRELFLDHRCAKCHLPKLSSPVPELAMDAPQLEGLGARRNFAWLVQWLLDPKSTRASVHMPRMFHGENAKADAQAVAAWLMTLRNEPPATPLPPLPASPRNEVARKEIAQRSGVDARPIGGANAEPPPTTRAQEPAFVRLHCFGCHNRPDTREQDATKISLTHVAARFSAGRLAEFLKAPAKHFAWTRMPDFKLADAEAKELADFLLKHAAPADSTPPPTEQALIERGRTLAQERGCLNCHSASIENRHSAPALESVKAEMKGCLAGRHDNASRAPDFGFNEAERRALLEFLRTDRRSLERYSPIEFAARQTRTLQCNACHGQIDLVPPLERLGGKLRPEWAARFIAGDPFKVRADIHPSGEPWVRARMPAFRATATLLAQGMAQQHGYPPTTPDYGTVDEAAARIGRQMIGKDNGLSCISCHAVNELSATEVFESEGINLGLTGERLRREYFFRWMRNPLAVDPQTKMPAYFEEGRSALTEYYDGDAEMQIRALFEYIRQGEGMTKAASGTE